MWPFLIALAFLFPAYQNGHAALDIDMNDPAQEDDLSGSETELESYADADAFDHMIESDYDNDDDDDDDEVDDNNELSDHEEQIDNHVKWRLGVDSVETQVISEFQNLTLISTKRYGKGLVIDGWLQTCEKDEFIFHENLVHPALLAHNGPKTVFIIGGGSGSTAREVLKHTDIERVIICEIDMEVVNLCRQHMTANHEAFNDERLQIIYGDAKEELETTEEKFDVIIGDMNIPEAEFSNYLYTKSFYENVVKPKLNDNGLFVTLAGPAGAFSHVDVFSPIHYTMKNVFTYVIPYKAQVPSSGDLCGWILASDAPIILDAGELDNRIGERIRGELYYLDGAVIVASTVLDKNMKESLVEEFNVVTEGGPALVRGAGLNPYDH